MKNPLSFLTKKQRQVVQKELKEEGYVVLQRYKNRKGVNDYRVLRDTVIITPTRIIDRIRWVLKKVIK